MEKAKRKAGQALREDGPKIKKMRMIMDHFGGEHEFIKGLGRKNAYHLNDIERLVDQISNRQVEEPCVNQQEQQLFQCSQNLALKNHKKNKNTSTVLPRYSAAGDSSAGNMERFLQAKNDACSRIVMLCSNDYMTSKLICGDGTGGGQISNNPTNLHIETKNISTTKPNSALGQALKTSAPPQVGLLAVPQLVSQQQALLRFPIQTSPGGAMLQEGAKVDGGFMSAIYPNTFIVAVAANTGVAPPPMYHQLGCTMPSPFDLATTSLPLTAPLGEQPRMKVFSANNDNLLVLASRMPHSLGQQQAPAMMFQQQHSNNTSMDMIRTTPETNCSASSIPLQTEEQNNQFYSSSIKGHQQQQEQQLEQGCLEPKQLLLSQLEQVSQNPEQQQKQEPLHYCYQQELIGTKRSATDDFIQCNPHLCFTREEDASSSNIDIDFPLIANNNNSTSSSFVIDHHDTQHNLPTTTTTYYDTVPYSDSVFHSYFGTAPPIASVEEDDEAFLQAAIEEVLTPFNHHHHGPTTGALPADVEPATVGVYQQMGDKVHSFTSNSKEHSFQHYQQQNQQVQQHHLFDHSVINNKKDEHHMNDRK
jgi:hypothetical protein